LLLPCDDPLPPPSSLPAPHTLQALHEAARTARKEVRGAQRLILHEDLKARKKVLKALGYIDGEGVVTPKVGPCCCCFGEGAWLVGGGPEKEALKALGHTWQTGVDGRLVGLCRAS